MRQGLLFETPLDVDVRDEIPGFTIEDDYITREEERALLEAVQDGPWESDFRRRVQQYGVGYGANGSTKWVREFPPWLMALARRVHADGYAERFPENSVVNEYVPGHGIGKHSDYGEFGPTVAAISLGSDVVMDFIEKESERKVSGVDPRAQHLGGLGRRALGLDARDRASKDGRDRRREGAAQPPRVDHVPHGRGASALAGRAI